MNDKLVFPGHDADYKQPHSDGGHVKIAAPTALVETDRPLSSPTRHPQYADHSLQASEVEKFEKAEKTRSIHVAPVSGVPESNGSGQE